MDLGQISVLQGNTFVVSDEQGAIGASPRVPAGPFAWDTRHLSKRQLITDGIKPRPLPVDDLQYSQTKFFLAPETAMVHAAVRRRARRGRAVDRRRRPRTPAGVPGAPSPSTTAPRLAFRTRQEPIGDHVPIDPAPPRGIGTVALLEIPGGRGRVDAFGRAGSRCAWRTSCCGGWSRADEAFGMECR